MSQLCISNILFTTFTIETADDTDSDYEFVQFIVKNIRSDSSVVDLEGTRKFKTEDIDEDEPPFDMDDPMDEETGMEFDFEAVRTEIRNKHKKATPEQKAEIKALRNGVTLDNIDDIEILTKMLEVFE